MRDSKPIGNSLLAAAAILGLWHAALEPAPQPPDEIRLWTPGGTTNATRPPRSRATHKQNARKAKKRRK